MRQQPLSLKEDGSSDLRKHKCFSGVHFRPKLFADILRYPVGWRLSIRWELRG